MRREEKEKEFGEEKRKSYHLFLTCRRQEEKEF